MIPLLAVLSLVVISGGQVVGHASIRAPAVIIQNNTGSLTTIDLTITKGNGTVSVNGPLEVANSTLQSAVTAAQYASAFLNLDYKDYNFNYTIIGAGENVSGPSGGEAMTLLAVSALSNKKLLNDFTVTGTISGNGSVGLIGGVYDKASAAKSNGMAFILVPAAGSDQFEALLYQLVQDTFGIPLIQVANTSQAYGYAFGTVPTAGKQTNTSLYVNYYVNQLPEAQIQCSNQCNTSDFNMLTNYTFDFANSSIATLAASSSSRNIASQLSSILAQDKVIAAKGYLYAGADQAFLGYLDSFFFNSNYANESTGLSALMSIQQYCDSLAPPQLTEQNYEFVLAGELRQSWAEYYANSSIATYNSSVETTDDVLQIMKDFAAPANAWCNAASEMYSIAKPKGGANVTWQSALAVVATNRISRAQPFATANPVYYVSARQAYSQQNYPLAILDADYAFALSNSSLISGNFTTGQLLNFSNQLAHNATFGVWATQFSNEAEFYIIEARLAQNQSTVRSYAESAFSAAYLAATLAPDMEIIYQNLTPGSSPAQPGAGHLLTQQSNTTQSQESTNATVSVLVQQTHEIFIIAVVMLVVNIVLFFMIVYLLLPTTKFSRNQLRNSKSRNRRNG